MTEVINYLLKNNNLSLTGLLMQIFVIFIQAE